MKKFSLTKSVLLLTATSSTLLCLTTGLPVLAMVCSLCGVVIMVTRK